ncbi:MAG: ABC transporter ATP-binding protein [Epulopiscium sp.]|nr:ABC transporter ATP-binding protein [Candidatus Epulonipiscium sp.]
MITFKHINFAYENSTENVLTDINMTIEKGELILLTGISGCGKTSLLRLINGLIPNFYKGRLTGELSINGENILEMSLREISREVNSVFQNPKSQFFNAIVQDELAFKSENYAYDPKIIKKKVDSALKLSRMMKFKNQDLFCMSGGEKQKISCLACDVFDADIIVLDEPSSNLDIQTIKNLMDKIFEWKAQGKTIIVAEHRLAYLRNLADKIVYMRSGKIEKIATPESFRKASIEEIHSKGLRAFDSVDFTEKKSIKVNEDGIKISNIDLTIEDKEVLNIKDVIVPKNATVAVIGLNGSGKSSFAKSFCGLIKESKENIYINGDKVNKKKRLKETFLVMQDINHQLFTESIQEEMEISLPTKCAKLDYENLLRSLNLIDYLEEHPMSLSGGQKQRLAIATALVSDRKVIIFDEPTSGLDFYHMLKVSKNILELKRKGKTVLIITHDPELIEASCDYVLFLESGKVKYQGQITKEMANHLGDFFRLEHYETKEKEVI